MTMYNLWQTIYLRTMYIASSVDTIEIEIGVVGPGSVDKMSKKVLVIAQLSC